MADNESSRLSWFLRGILILAWLLLMARLFELTVIKGGYYRSLANGNRIRRIPVPAPRGVIRATAGEVLVANREVKMGLVFNDFGNFEILSSWDSKRKVEQVNYWSRSYPLKEMAGHLTGYVGEVSPEELGKVDSRCPSRGQHKLGEQIGRAGLELIYNCELSGVDGENLVEEDASGKVMRVLGEKKPIPGQDLVTNINLPLQQKVAGLMSGKTGAVIATNSTGQVLAFYSAPSYDPAKIVDYTRDPAMPLFDRVISALYQPGSVFKPLVAVAGLETKVIDKNWQYEDTGSVSVKSQFGDYSYANWYFTQYGRTEGKINLERAIARSTDTFFYKLGEMLTVDKIVSWAKKFGLNTKSGIDLPGEVDGFIPDPLWKERAKNEKWWLGNTYHLAIGQGDLLLTPILINSLTTTVANGGRICSPKIFGQGECRDLKIGEDSLAVVRAGMIDACSPGGTGYVFSGLPAGRQAGCKTGTAETGDGKTTHAWFTVFAPAIEPKIILTIIIEKGGEGSSVAGPVAKEILDAYFGGN